MSSYDALTASEYREFGVTHDLPILESVVGRSRITMLHICRKNIMFDLLVDYPVDVVHWADRAGPPSLGEARRSTAKALSGGLSVDTLLSGTEEEISAEARDAIVQTGGRGLILSAGCVINTRTPAGNLRAARRATERKAL
jgi:uroporphyrinogen decarboxylase